MIQCFNNITSKDAAPLQLLHGQEMPRLISASYITNDFSQHARLLHNHHDRLEVMFVRTGHGLYIVDNTGYPIQSGDVIVCNNEVMHDEVPQYNKSLSMLNVGISHLSLPGLPENHLIAPSVIPILNTHNQRNLFETIFQTIFDFLSINKEQYNEINQYLTLSLISLLINEFDHYGEAKSDKKSDKALLNGILHYIDNHYMENLTLEKISEYVNISPSRLSHLFKKELGYSPMNYISRRRIGEAQSLLIMSPKSIADIAFSVGFENLSNFSIIFKKYVGLPPNVYRKKYTRSEK